MTANHCPWWSSGYDVHLDSKRLEFDPFLVASVISELKMHEDMLSPWSFIRFLVASVISELTMHEDMLSPWRGKRDSDQCPWWSSSYNAWPDSKRLGFNSPIEAQNCFGSLIVTYSTHCYSTQ